MISMIPEDVEKMVKRAMSTPAKLPRPRAFTGWAWVGQFQPHPKAGICLGVVQYHGHGDTPGMIRVRVTPIQPKRKAKK